MIFCISAATSGSRADFQAGPEESKKRSNPPKTGLVYDDIFLRHDTGPHHPETASRLKAVMSKLKESGLLNDLIILRPKQASLAQVASIHSMSYIREVEQACKEGAGYLHSPDTPISRESYEVALYAAGGVITAIDLVMNGEVKNAFCAIRPPGHHACRNRAKGFCLFNNIAIGARHLLEQKEIRRTAIVDWDVHHGNGTQDAFYEDPDVLYISIHQYPFYPGSGHAGEKGAGKGRGLTLNIPLPAGSGDEEHLNAFEKKVMPALKAFAPDFILISAGFDSHENDPLGGLRVSGRGFAEMTRMLKDAAEELCGGRIVSVLEGGYDHDALADSVYRHLKALME